MEEGIFVGGSAGAAVHVGIQVAKQLDKGQTVVVILPDTGRSYITKIFSDDWMREKGFLETEGERIHVQAILDAKKHNISKIISIKPDDSIQSAISLMVENGISQLPVMEGDVAIGSVSEQNLVEKFVDLNGNDKQLCWELCGKKIKEVMELPLPSVNKTDSINNPLLLLKNSNAMLVIDEKHPVDIITMTDVINYFMGR